MRRTASTRVFAVLGHPVAHSLSPRMHTTAFRVLGLDAVYVALPCEEGELPALMRALVRSGGGGNVTVPHKRAAARAVDTPTAAVRATGACNTFWGQGSELAGDNTDIDGILAAFAELGSPPGAWCVAGTGGAAEAVVQAAQRLGVAVAFRSRDPARAARLAERAHAAGVARAKPAEAAVLINATPLGLHPTDPLPFPGHPGPDVRAALDLVYAPGGTSWVRSLVAAGLRAADGRELLLAQGTAAFERWFPGLRAPRDAMRAELAHALG